MAGAYLPVSIASGLERSLSLVKNFCVNVKHTEHTHSGGTGIVGFGSKDFFEALIHD